MKYFSLFSGIGGFEYGIKEANDTIKKRIQQRQRQEGKRNSTSVKSCMGTEQFYCIGYSEINKYAKAIYRYHYPEHKNYGDATKIISGELPDFDLLVGGFPCQSFSIAGKRKGMSGEDIRGTLFFEIWRIARDKRPRTLLLENVPGLLSSQGGKDFQTILQSLDEIGYDVEWDCLNSKNFGVPQNRQRVFIVGHLRGQSFKKVFSVGAGNQNNDGLGETTGEGGQGIQALDICPALATGEKWKAFVSATLSAGYYKRQHGQTMINNNAIRRFTPTECERLQAFPDGWTEWGIDDSIYRNCGICKECDYVDYDKIYSDIKCVIKISDTQRYKCLGNAVTTSVIKEIIKKMFN